MQALTFLLQFGLCFFIVVFLLALVATAYDEE